MIILHIIGAIVLIGIAALLLFLIMGVLSFELTGFDVSDSFGYKKKLNRYKQYYEYQKLPYHLMKKIIDSLGPNVFKIENDIIWYKTTAREMCFVDTSFFKAMVVSRYINKAKKRKQKYAMRQESACITEDLSKALQREIDRNTAKMHEALYEQKRIIDGLEKANHFQKDVIKSNIEIVG